MGQSLLKGKESAGVSNKYFMSHHNLLLCWFIRHAWLQESEILTLSILLMIIAHIILISLSKNYNFFVLIKVLVINTKKVKCYNNSCIENVTFNISKQKESYIN